MAREASRCLSACSGAPAPPDPSPGAPNPGAQSQPEPPCRVWMRGPFGPSGWQSGPSPMASSAQSSVSTPPKGRGSCPVTRVGVKPPEKTGVKRRGPGLTRLPRAALRAGGRGFPGEDSWMWALTGAVRTTPSCGSRWLVSRARFPVVVGTEVPRSPALLIKLAPPGMELPV